MKYRKKKLSPQYVTILVLDAFGVSDRSGRKLMFLTHTGSVIPPLQLKKVIDQFQNCGCFVLKMVFTDHKESQSDLSVVSGFLIVFNSI